MNFETMICPTLVSITVICYFFDELIKMLNHSFNHKYLPMTAAGFGVILSLIGYFLKFESFAGKDFYDCISIGICSGLASSGGHDFFKGLDKNNKEQHHQCEDEEKQSPNLR